ncbi:MAG: hypothetical protein AAGE01_06405 [Pseudomonadota bacterium]
MGRKIVLALGLALSCSAIATPVGLPTFATLSGDGNVVAFVTSPDGRVVNGNLYTYNRSTGVLRQINVPQAGGVAGSTVGETPSLSVDGAKVFFESCNGLRPEISFGAQKSCVLDVTTGTLTAIGRNSDGELLSASLRGTLAANGNHVAFGSLGTTTPDDTNQSFNVDGLVRTIGTGPTVLISRDEAGIQSRNTTSRFDISEDGIVASFSFSNGAGVGSSIFVRDVAGATSELVSVDSAGDEIVASRTFFGDLSDDGRYVVFATDGRGVLEDLDSRRDIYLRDRQLGSTELITRNTSGNPSNADAFTPLVSRGGRFVAFSSAASDLVSGDVNGVNDVFLRDRDSNSTTLVSVASDGAPAVAASDLAGLSQNGRFVLFQSNAANLAPGGERCIPAGGVFCNLYLRDTLLGTTELIPPSTLGLAAFPPLAGIDGGDRFGSAVAVDGDRIAVGVPEDNGGGRVIVYRVVGGTPVVEQEIPVPAGFTAIRFGAAVALRGSLLAIGAPGSSGAKGASLQAALYERVNDDWRIKQPLASSGGNVDDGFGTAVSIDGSVIAVGAPGDAEGEAQGSGAVYLFDFEGSLADKAKMPTPVAGAALGTALAADGGRLAVGAPGSAIASAFAGSVELYDIISGNLAPLGTASSDGASSGDAFGASIAIEGNRMAVGAPGDDGFGTDQGLVYVFSVDGDLRTETRTLNPPGALNNGAFGAALAFSGAELIVGAPGANNGAGQTGAAYRFNEDFVVVGQLIPEPGQSEFGAAVAAGPDLIVVGAPGSNSDAGSASVRRDVDLLFRAGFE